MRALRLHRRFEIEPVTFGTGPALQPHMTGSRVDRDRQRPAQQPAANDDVVFLGLSPGADREAADMARRTGARVTFIGDPQNQGGALIDGRRHDLSNRTGIDSFTRTLGLPGDQGARVADAIEQVSPQSRDEMANLANVWSRAEKGGTIPSRFVLSGESNGDGAWGRGRMNGEITLADFDRLAQAMPRAARQIEDLHLATCNSGGEPTFNRWKQILPNARTMWGYGGSAPGAASGASAHLQRWERSTRGRADALDPAAVKGTRKGENVDTWSTRDGFRSGKTVVALADARRAYEGSRTGAERFMRGDEDVADPQTGPLRDHYNNIHTLLRNTELPANERRPLESERDRTVRMLYYGKTVAPAFAQEYRDALGAGHAALGRAVPDFARMPRKAALEEISAFERAAAGRTEPAVRRTLELLRGLRDLSPQVIPNSWIA